MKTLAYIFLTGLLTLPQFSSATSITALENLNLSNSTLEGQIGKPASRASYSNALRSYLGQTENSCSRSEEIFGQTADVAERLPGFSKRLWSQSNTESFTVGDYKIQKVARPFNALMLFGHPSFCAKKTCDAKDQLLLEQWTMAVAGTSLYLIEKKGKYTGAQLALIPVVESENKYTLIVTTDPLKYLQKKSGERELLSLITQAITTGKSKLGKLALLKQIPGSNRYQVVEMLAEGIEGPEIAPINQFHLNDPMVPNLLSLVTKNCLEPNRKGLAKKTKTPTSTTAEAAGVPAQGSVNVSVGGAGGPEAAAGENKSTTNNNSNNNINSNNSKKTIASQEESLQPGSLGSGLVGGNNFPEGLGSGSSDLSSNPQPKTNTISGIGIGVTPSTSGGEVSSKFIDGSNSNNSKSLNQGTSKNNNRSSNFGGPNGFNGSGQSFGGVNSGRFPTGIGEKDPYGKTASNSPNGGSPSNNSSNKGSNTETAQLSAADQKLKDTIDRANQKFPGGGNIPNGDLKGLLKALAEATAGASDPSLKDMANEAMAKVYLKNPDSYQGTVELAGIKDKTLKAELINSLNSKLCYYCTDCIGCKGWKAP